MKKQNIIKEVMLEQGTKIFALRIPDCQGLIEECQVRIPDSIDTNLDIKVRVDSIKYEEVIPGRQAQIAEVISLNCQGIGEGVF